MEIDKGLIYAERDGFRPLELDLYRADGMTAPAPLVVFVHGGGWRTSHRTRAPRETRDWDVGFFERITDAGFVLATPEYRFSAEATFPAPLDDIVDALRWLEAHGPDFGAAQGRTYLWGASAGGNLSALAALVDGAPPVAGVVCWYGIMDLLALDLEATDSFEALLLGGPIGERRELARAASPVAHVRPDAPPFLLQHGGADVMVAADQSVRLADALRACGARVEVEIVAGADHFFEGWPDVEGVFDRALGFLLDLDQAAG